MDLINTLSWAFLVFLVGLLGLFAFVTTRYIVDSVHLYRAVKELGMDMLAVHQRMARHEVAEFLRDVASKLRERSELLLFKTERIAQGMLAGTPEEMADGLGILVLVHGLRETLGTAGPYDVWFLNLTLGRFQSSSTPERFAENLREWKQLRKRGAVFGRYMQRYGRAVTSREQERRGTP